MSWIQKRKKVSTQLYLKKLIYRFSETILKSWKNLMTVSLAFLAQQKPMAIDLLIIENAYRQGA
ncbi:MAG: hypothetical protein VKL41_00550 [Snowella sp.]|nr:hypothetical protein [Snowella sp.]